MLLPSARIRRFPLALVLGAATVVIAGSCTSGVALQCAPNQQVACPCPGNASGVQTCRNDGSGFSLCNCGAPTTSASSGNATAGGTTGAGGATTATTATNATASSSSGMGMTSVSSSSTTGGGPSCAPSFAPIDLGPLSVKYTHTAVAADCNAVFVATNVDGAGAVNAVLTKYTMTGQIAGTKSLSGAFDQSIAAIDTDGMGGVWVAANIAGPVTLAGCPSIGTAGSSQLAVLHLDASFNCLEAAGYNDAVGAAIVNGPAGSVIIGAAVFPNCTFDHSTVFTFNAATVVRLTPMGSGFHVDWTHYDRLADTGGPPGVAKVTGLATTTNNGGQVAVTGYMHGQGFIVGNLQGNSPSNGMSDDGYFTVLDAQHGIAGESGFFGASTANADTHPNAVTFDASGDPVIVGRAPAGVSFNTPSPPTIDGPADAFAVSYNNNSPHWVQTFGGSGVDEATAVLSTPQGIALAGAYSGSGTAWSVPACQKNLPGPNTAFVASLDGTGACVDNQAFNDMGSAGASAQALALNANGAFMTGAFSGTLYLGNTQLVTQNAAEGFLASVALP